MRNDPETHRSDSITRRAFMGMTGGSAAYILLGGHQSKAHGAPMASSRDTSRTTIERYLGATRSAMEELSEHEHDGYYLGTPYGTVGPNRFSSDFSRWDCWHPNGKPASDGEAYMNCTGFVVAVLEACGADCDIIGTYVDATGYDVGTKANLSRWRHFLDEHASLRVRYESKKELLSSGLLRKGDLILAEPNDWSVPDADDHIMFFWGDSPDQDLAWHSAPDGDGIVSGKAPGNMISRITAKTADCYWLHVPLTNLIEVLVTKSSAEASISGPSGENPAYSLAGASFSVFRTFSDGQLSNLATTFETDSEGHASLSLAPGEEVWLREDEAPLGFVPWDAPKRLVVGRDNPFRANIEDEPCTVTVLLYKEDRETGRYAQGWGTLEGAAYELVDASGTTHRAETAWDEDRKGWVAKFSGLPRGGARIREVIAPPGYRIDASGEGGWHAVTLSPDSHDSVFTIEIGPYEESVVRGDIVGAKFGESDENDSKSVKSPLAGCEFAIWLQDDGSLESKGYDIEPIVDALGHALCDESGAPCLGFRMGVVESHEDGRFTTQDLLAQWNPADHGGASKPEHALPYGTYTLVETRCPNPSFALIDPIRGLEVRVQSQEVFLMLEDERIASPVRIRKVDATTGLPLLKQGTVVELLVQQDDGSLSPIELPDRYPNNESTSSFVIGEEGFVWLPSRLPQGTYAIRETTSIPPYLLSDEPVFFVIDEHHDWDDEDIVEITLENKAATGAIKGVKRDHETGDGVEGAAFEIRAAHEIKMPDGTVAFQAGEVAGTAFTDEKGTWEISKLPLGDGSAVYEIREIIAPSGYILDETVHTVTLDYADESTAEVECSFESEDFPTELLIRKVDAETRAGIEGVEISIFLAESESEKTTEEGNPERAEETEEGTAGYNRVPIAVLATDSDGCARITGLDNDETYVVYETSERGDLGYVAAGERLGGYLSPEGRWFESRNDYEEADDRTAGEARLELELLNDFTKIALYKVDEEAWGLLEKSTVTDERERTRLERASMLSGGVFRLLDERGDTVSEDTDGAYAAKEWGFPTGEPKTFTRLAVGGRYVLQEIAPPDGYARGPETAFVVEKTTEVQSIVISNEKNRGFPETGDGLGIVAAGIGLAAIGGVAFAARMKTRMDGRGRKGASGSSLDDQNPVS